jgi:hypothetical protein
MRRARVQPRPRLRAADDFATSGRSSLSSIVDLERPEELLHGVQDPIDLLVRQ